MALLQIAAAHLAEVDSLIYHTFAKEFTAAYEQALQIFKSCVTDASAGAPTLNVTNFIAHVQSQKFKWGQSDGT